MSSIDTERRKGSLLGWRNLITKVEYYNVSTQTLPKKMHHQNLDNCQFSNTSTQVIRIDKMDKCTNTARDKLSQTSDCNFPAVSDKIKKVAVSPSAVSPAVFGHQELPDTLQNNNDNEEYKNLEEVVLKIQSFYRAYSMRKAVKSFYKILRGDSKESNEKENQHLEKFTSSFIIVEKKEVKTKEDFDMLYKMLDHWRSLETRILQRNLFDASRISANNIVLLKEIQLLRGIEEIKIKLKFKRQEKRTLRFLEKLRKGLLWKTSKNQLVSVETRITRNARCFYELYHNLSKEETSVSARMNLLQKIRDLIESHECNYSQEIDYLIDQEMYLISRNVSTAFLRNLRNRLKLLFLYLAQSSLKPANHEGPAEDFKLCKSCRQMLPLSRFALNFSYKITECKSCKELKASGKEIWTFYEDMIRNVQKFELKRKCYQSVCFVVDKKVVYHLVNNIWHKKSGISESSDLSELTLVRFHTDSEWSPWNSLVLTKKEAILHYSIKNIHQVYGEALIQQFQDKNMQALVSYQSLLHLHKKISSLGDRESWKNGVGDPRKI